MIIGRSTDDRLRSFGEQMIDAGGMCDLLNRRCGDHVHAGGHLPSITSLGLENGCRVADGNLTQRCSGDRTNGNETGNDIGYFKLADRLQTAQRVFVHHMDPAMN